MDLSLTDAQELLKNTARDFLERECPWTRVRDLVEHSDSGFDPELWRQTVDLGWPAMIIPEEYEGIGASMTDLGVLYEEMGRALLPTPHFSTAVLGAMLIMEAGSEEQKRALLPRIASGDLILSFAFTEPDYGWEPKSVQLRAARRDGGWQLDGTKLFVHDAQIADVLVVVARTGGDGASGSGLTLFLVDRQTSGLTQRDVEGWVKERANELTFEAVVVPEGNVLGQVDGGWQALEPVLDKAAVVLSAFMAGAGARVVELGVDYANNRVQFGSPIGTFPRVQDHIINANNQVDGGKWTTYEALWKIDSGQDFAMAASVAKAASSEGFHTACNLIHEVHAAIGTTRDMAVYLYTMTARTLYDYLGNPQHHRRRLARLLEL